MQTSTQAVRARTDEPFLERFIQAHEAFVLRCASRHAGFAVTRSDDEYSVALLAFYEAIEDYDPESGPFGAYASLVIGRRLADHYRSQHRFDAETPLAPQTFDGTVDRESADAAMQQAVAEQMSEAKPISAQEEIEAANTVFEKCGFAFYDLAASSPKSDKTRRSCAAAVGTLLHSPVLFASMQSAHSLPIKALAEDGADSVEYTVNRFDQVLGTRVSGKEQPPDGKILRFAHIDKAVEHTVRQEAKEGERVSITVTSRSSGHAERLREHIDDRFRQSGDERNPPEVRVQPPEKPGNAPGESRPSESAEQA